MPETVQIDTEFIKLDSLLKLANLVMSGGEAKLLITDRQVLVNGQHEVRRGRKLYPGDMVAVTGRGTVLIC